MKIKRILMACFVVVFTIFILAICNFDFGFDKVNKNNSNIDSAKSKQSESKSLPTSAEKDKSNSKSKNKEDDTEDDSYVRKTIGVLLDTENLNNESYNNNVLSALKRADEDFDVRIKLEKPKTSKSFKESIEKLHKYEPDLIIAVGARFAEPIKEAATKYPKQQFAIVDYTYKVQPVNVISVSFQDNVTGYLAGLIAGKMTDTGKVGFIGGVEGSSRDKYESGFRKGLKTSNKDAELLVKYSNIFENPESARTIAKEMRDSDRDVVFSATEDDSKRAIQVARENGGKVIAINKDQYDMAPDNVISSIIKDVEQPVYELIKNVAKDGFKGSKVMEFKIKDGELGLTSKSSRNIPPDVLEYIKKEYNKVKDTY
ncbi:TPA: BMP family ABC transporter substrate-binding protein [Clostridioides difficile]|uniref:BMP family ABC transporter substrate-binding protein n=1 Tax=Clostridioides difficile TaxID=1496 RepID=UPI0002E888DF|nr:BMP family ABC transporter substrate-binding protein [Clostridioides difficile]EQG77751.1 ABC transporter substrate binding family protein [Clostridioides difficile DA00165]EAA0011042.1 BMP family ABC transporter substrate-binding protein [Clostridioides difficile]EGT3745605.1 BMP family ABC transporter substrate-binding protein [Clostridioides difficile]EGT3780534.1 BMP family ABC transporter substrate-binding protein [Clostridioides difficile]EGT3786959.1 BMP family ABC transporter substr